MAPDTPYPAPRTGTAQDLFRHITRGYELELQRGGIKLPAKSHFQRLWLEPLCRVLGMGVAKTLELLPASWALSFHDKLFASLAAPRAYPFDPARPELARARALVERLEKGGKAPALLALISHPPVMGELAHLNFELVRHATLSLWTMRGRPCRPRLVVAVDPFALDTIPLAQEGLYAGFMGSYHLGLDRLALRGHPGPRLSPQTSWASMPLRLLRLLARGGEAGLVLSGGVPSTGRVLYGAREWTKLAAARSPLRRDPAEVLRRLGSSAPREDLLPPPRGAWKALEARLMSAAAGLSGETAEAAAGAVLEALDVAGSERASLLEELGRDLARETPARRRLFRVFAKRLLRRRPVVFLPVVHRVSPLGVEPREAWSWELAPSGRLRARRADRPDEASELSPEDFALRFVEENFA